MSLKDLQHDALLAENLTGKLEASRKNYAVAVTHFQAVLYLPLATKKYGGFLDLGIESFYNLMLLSLQTSPTLDEAAEKFDRAVDWQKIASNDLVDLRESLGLVIREQKWTDAVRQDFEQRAKLKIVKPSEILGDYALSLGRPGLAPEENATIESELPKTEYATPAAKLELFYKILDYTKLPFDQKAQIVALYTLLKGAK